MHQRASSANYGPRRGPSLASLPALLGIHTGAGDYTDGEPKSYEDINHVAWVIQDNDCGAFDIECSMTDIQNRYWATQRIRRYAFDPVPSLRSDTLNGVKVLIDKFAANHDPTIVVPGGPGTDDPDIKAGDDVRDNDDGTVTITKPKPGGGTIVITKKKPASMAKASGKGLGLLDVASLAVPPAVGWYILGPWGGFGGAALSAAIYAFTDKK